MCSTSGPLVPIYKVLDHMPLYVGWAYVCPFLHVLCVSPKFVFPLHTYMYHCGFVLLLLLVMVWDGMLAHSTCMYCVWGFHRYAFACGTNEMKWDEYLPIIWWKWKLVLCFPLFSLLLICKPFMCIPSHLKASKYFIHSIESHKKGLDTCLVLSPQLISQSFHMHT